MRFVLLIKWLLIMIYSTATFILALPFIILAGRIAESETELWLKGIARLQRVYLLADFRRQIKKFGFSEGLSLFIFFAFVAAALNYVFL